MDLNSSLTPSVWIEHVELCAVNYMVYVSVAVFTFSCLGLTNTLLSISLPPFQTCEEMFEKIDGTSDPNVTYSVEV